MKRMSRTTAKRRKLEIDDDGYPPVAFKIKRMGGFKEKYETYTPLEEALIKKINKAKRKLTLIVNTEPILPSISKELQNIIKELR